MTRVGIGYDIHRLESGAKLVLGGTIIDAPFGAVGHSDADTLTHAIIDAILGAACAGDIGEHFPSSDPNYRGVSSTELLTTIMSRLHSAGWSVINVDSIVILERPKLLPYKKPMRETIAAILDIQTGAVSIKAKTKEGLGEVGAGSAVEAHAVALLQSESDDSESFWV